jgi:hypothetical protein
MIHPYLRYVRVTCGALAGLVLAGCGLISSDVTNFDLTLPDKNFTIDTGRWQVDQTAADMVLVMPCSSSTMCTSAVQAACPMGCTGTCNAVQKCDVSLDVSLSQPVNLLAEKPELKSINDQPVIKVTLDSVTYDVTSNSLNVDTPEITVYVAPMAIVKVSHDDQIKAIGTIAPVPAGQITDKPHSLVFTATGKADLVNIMSTFKMPFNVLVGSSIVISAGQPVPAGKLEAVVHIKGHAGL